VGKVVTLATTGGSGSGIVTYKVSGSGCVVSGNLLKATKVTTCAVTATKAAAGIYASTSSAIVKIPFKK
jgi:uncharacterized Ntn-hydrolase superfamily protein